MRSSRAPTSRADQTTWAMGEILSGEATPAQIAGFAVSLRAKGETVEEITGLVDRDVREGAPRSDVPGRLLDVVGTGGDRSMSVNISTMAAIVAAGAGARVVKHGNRSASSQSGSADVLEALGVRLDLPPERVAAAGRRGRHHLPASPRRSTRRCGTPPCRAASSASGRRSTSSGPLANPTRPAANAVGCADPRMAPVMAGVFAAPRRRTPGSSAATTGSTSSPRPPPRRCGWSPGARSAPPPSTPPRHGLAPATTEDLRGGDAAHNADVVRRLLDGEPGAGPRRRAAQRRRRARGLRRAGPGAVDEALDAGHRPGRARPSTPVPRRHTLERWVAASAVAERGRARPARHLASLRATWRASSTYLSCIVPAACAARSW